MLSIGELYGIYLKTVYKKKKRGVLRFLPHKTHYKSKIWDKTAKKKYYFQAWNKLY